MAVSHRSQFNDYMIVDGKGFIPSGTEVVRTTVFRGNKELVKVEIPESVVSIDPGTFFGCTNLESIEIHKSVESLEYKDDRGVFSISDTPPFSSLRDVLVNKGWDVSLYKSPSQDPHFWD